MIASLLPAPLACPARPPPSNLSSILISKNGPLSLSLSRWLAPSLQAKARKGFDVSELGLAGKSNVPQPMDTIEMFKHANTDACMCGSESLSLWCAQLKVHCLVSLDAMSQREANK